MRGFRGLRGTGQDCHAILFLVVISVLLFSAGCSGLVSGTNGGGGVTLSISNILAGNATPTSVTIDWQTNVAANSQVEYGTTANYGSTTPLDSTMATSHQVAISNLKPGTAYHCRVHSTDANNHTVISGDLACPTSGDTTPPTVSITSPAANATLSGTVTVTASASDDVAVASVQFKVDNANTGAAITTAPYSYSFNTTTLSDGNHVLTAVATDTSGNSATSAGVPVKVSNTSPVPSISSLNPASGLVGTSVTIAGANFGATQGTSTVSFNGTTATPTSWSAASIATPVPAGATTGSVVVTVGGVASNGMNFTVTTPGPSITSLNPTSGLVGTSVTISGANFGATQGTSTVSFNGTTATPTSWSAASIAAPVPAGATTGSVVVTVGGVASNGMNFTVTTPGPSISSLNPTSGLVGTSVTIAGANFGATQGTSTVSFNGTTATPTSWSAASIAAPVPAGATTGSVVVTVGGAASNGMSFTVTVPAPNISGLNPTSGLVGTSVTISGANFGATQGSSKVKFNGVTATPTSWSAASIAAPVPAGATTGSVVVTVGGAASNGMSFTVTVPAPNISGLNPTSGLVGTSVTISGANFGATQGSSKVKFNGVTATPTSWSATSIAAPVPSGATTGSVVVTVGGVASNGMSFTVQADTTPPVVNVTAPANNATVSGTITLTATATDPDSPVSFVQFLVDGANSGPQLTASPYSTSLDTTTLSNGAHAITATAQDPSGNKGTSAAVSITVSNSTSSAMGPLKQSTVNTRYLVTPSGTGVFLAGSHTWDDFQDTDTNVGSTPAPFNFNAFVNFLKAHNQNATILWRKDLPEYCGWDVSGSTWRIDPWPWLRPGPGVATDGKPKFDLTQFNQAYFDRLRSQIQQLQQNGIYAIIELFDGNQLTTYRCSTDGYPFTSTNNINGVSDGYSSGGCGVGSVTMTTNNAITNYQDAYVKKVIDTVNDLPNVLYEIAEEQPGSSFSGCQGYGGASSMTFWAPHMFGLIKTYEGGGTWEGITYPGKPAQHPYGIGSMNYGDRIGGDTHLYGSTAVWIAPSINSGVDKFPSNVAVNNQGKVVINDSDHALGWKAMLNSSGGVLDSSLRTYIWENVTQGAEGLVFMDPYVIDWPSSPTRNACQSPVHQVCSGVDTKWDNFRTAVGIAQAFVNSKMDLVKATPQGSLSSTGFCLADNSATGAEYLVYAPSGGTFTVNLSATTRVLTVEWLDTATGATSAGASITGGSSAQSFTAPFSGDVVLYLVDAAGHN